MTIPFFPIATARHVTPGQVAFLLMPCGCERKCVFEAREVAGADGAHAYAWWPFDEAGAAIGLYSPLAWLPLYNELEARVQ